MEILETVISFILHIDKHLAEIISNYGALTYGILFVIIFIETGLVVTPFLPGDSLLFAAGAFAALGTLNIWLLLLLLIVAAVLGDTANYWIGHIFGDRILKNPRIPINPEHVEKTENFFEKHGGKTIILARFVPIVRTFAPFVAGIGKMHYGRFLSYNVVGGITWIVLFLFAGYFFGNIPAVQHNFTLVIVAIILLSVLPMVYHAVKEKLTKSHIRDTRLDSKDTKKKKTI
ncbi:DedA family protein [Candidatus Woesebacteria bacterium]|nr:MAG: DedA family protein [Candidatus Woesebacteria bacterium]